MNQVTLSSYSIIIINIILLILLLDPLVALNRLVNEYSQYDLLFIDIYMPQLDGVELCKLIRKTNKNKDHAPLVVAMSTNCDDDLVNRCMDADFDIIIQKPIDRNKVRIIYINRYHLSF